MRFTGCISAVLSFVFIAVSAWGAEDEFEKLIKSGDYNKAIEYAAQKIPRERRTVDVLVKLAMAYYKTGGKKEQIIGCLEDAQKVNPADPAVYMALGNYYLEMKQYADALANFQKAYLLENTGAAAEKIAVCAAKVGEWEKARDAAESALILDAELLEPREILSAIYLKEKNWEGAAEQLEKIAAKEPSVIGHWRKLSQCYQALNREGDLARVNEKIVALDKRDAAARSQLAAYKLAAKDTSGAYALYKELAVLKPGEKETFAKLYEIAVSKGEKKDATLYLKNYLVLDSTNAELFKTLGELLYEQKDADGALDAYRKAVRLDQKIKGFYGHYIGLVLAKKLDDEAVSVITAAIGHGEADGRAYSALGDIYRKNKNYAKAAAMYQEALKADPKNVELLVALAQSQSAAGDIKNAIITYEQVVMLKQGAREEYKALGDLHMKAGKRSEAIAAYRRYVDNGGGDDETAKAVGMHDFGAKQYGQAIKYLEMVKSAGVQDAEFLASLGEAYYQTGNCAKAIDAIGRARAKNQPAEALKTILPMAAQCYEKANDAIKAAEAYEAYTKLAGVRDADASYKSAYLREKANPSEAMKIYEKNTAAFPADWRNFVRLGMMYAGSETTLAKAASNLTTASTLVDTNADVWRTLAVVQGKLKNTAAELAAYQKLLKLQPQDIDANKRVGLILMQRKQAKEAIANLEIALTALPKDIDILLALADGYAATDRLARAVELLDKALALRPADLDLRFRVYEMSKQSGNDKKAEEEIRHIIAQTKDNKYRIMYAGDLMRQKRAEEAYKVALEIQKNDPMNVEGHMLVARALRDQKKYDESIEAYKSVLYINDNYAAALLERGEVYLLQNKPDRAQEYFLKALKADPKLAMAELGLARVAKARKDMQEYTVRLNKARALDPKNKEILEETKSGGK